MNSLSFPQRVRLRVSASWKFFTALLLPIVLLPFVFMEDDGEITIGDIQHSSTKFKALYVVIIMAVYWALEIIPLPVTALIPLVLFPLLGVQSAYTVSQNYTKESNMIFLGSVIVALAVEYCGLHNRIALKVMSLGSSPIQLLFGTMLAVAMLAMWISATSCVAILVPVVCALIDEIHESPEILSENEIRKMSLAPLPTPPPNHHGSNPGSLFLVSEDPRGAHHNNNTHGGRRGSIASSSNQNHRIITRRSSSASPTTPQIGSFPYGAAGGRRNTLVFGNLGLSSSFSHHGPLYEAVGNRAAPRPPHHLRGFHGSNSSFSVGGADDLHYMDHGSGILSDKASHGGSIPHVNIITDDHHDQDEDPEGLERKREQYLEYHKAHEEKRIEIKKMFLFGMAYAANIGGTAVITGTSPNKVFKEVIKPLHVGENGHLNMTFFTWVLLNVPAVLLNILIAWLYLSITYYGLPSRKNWPILRKLCCCCSVDAEEKEAQEIHYWRTREVGLFLKREYQKLGRITFHEISVLIIFMLVVVLWMFRDPELVHGWGDHTPNDTTGDSTAAILGVLLLFVFPKNLNFLFAKDKESAVYEALLDWKYVTTKMPWGVLLLLGSGFAIADASLYSGLSDWIGEELSSFSHNIPKPYLLLIVIVITSVLTEVVSNVACANILLPVIVSVIHPLYLTVAVALTCQYAFLFPIATPSNALVFAAGNFTTAEMVRTGLFLNLICVAVLYTNTITYGDWLFQYDVYNFTRSETTPHSQQ